MGGMSYPSGYAPQVPFATDQRPQDGVVVAIAWVCAVLTGLYLLPWAIAATRGKSNQAMIGVLNLLLGWTVVGWIVTLVMSCTAHTMVGVAVAAPSGASIPAGWYASPSGEGQEYWDGTAWTGQRTP
jgi:T4 superinfection immunity protein